MDEDKTEKLGESTSATNDKPAETATPEEQRTEAEQELLVLQDQDKVMNGILNNTQVYQNTTQSLQIRQLS